MSIKLANLDELAKMLWGEFIAETMKAESNSIGDTLFQEVFTVFTENCNSHQLKEFNSNPQNLRSIGVDILTTELTSNAKFRRLVLSYFGYSVHSSPHTISVFISYRRSTSYYFVNHLVERLNRTKRVIAKFDESHLKAGNFVSQLGQLIQRSDVLCLVLQANSMNNIGNPDDYIRRELVTAIKLGKPILPISVDTNEVYNKIQWPSELKSLKYLQCLDFKTGPFYDVSEKRLITSIYDLLK